jgi:hypothetical protein
VIFNFCLANMYRPEYSPPDRLTLASVLGDGIRFLRRALEEAGHDVVVSTEAVYKDAINLFWDRFYYFDNGVDMPAQLRQGGYRFGIVCTEPFNTGTSFNPFEFEPGAARQIYEQFAHSARQADFVWHLLEEAGPACRSFNPNSHFLPFGHVSGYAELGDPARRRAVADFVIQGFITPRRQELVTALTQKGYRVIASHFQPDYVRLSQMESARVALSPQKSAGHSIFSFARVYHALMNRVPMIVEYDGPATYLSPYCLVARSENFGDICQAYVRRKDLPKLVQDNHDRLARERPMRPIMDRLLKDTLGLEAVT